MDQAAFEEKLSALFHGGEFRRRELRLTRGEYDYLVRTYPRAGLTPMGGDWYELVWKEAF